MARLARTLGKRGVLLPALSAEDASLVEGVNVYRVTSLDQAFRLLSGEKPRPPLNPALARVRPSPEVVGDGHGDFSEIKGQHALRRAVEVAVSGSHNLLIFRCSVCRKNDDREADFDHHPAAKSHRASRDFEHPFRRQPHYLRGNQVGNTALPTFRPL